MGILFLQFFLISDKLSLLIFISFHCFNAFLNTFFKILYASDRPFMQFDELQVFSCEISLGKPSGHAQSSIFFYIFLMEFVNSRLDLKKMKFLRPFINILTFGIIFLIGLSRIFKGVHSFSQVLLGWGYGQFSLFFWLFARKRLYDLLKKRSNGTIRAIGRESGNLILYMIMTIFLTILSFNLRSEHTDFPDYELNNLEKKCGVKLTTRQLFEKTLLSTAYILVVFGLVQGFIVTRGSLKPELYRNGISQFTWWKVLLRFVILAISLLVILGVPYGINTDPEVNIYLILFLKNYLPYFIVGLFLIYLLPKIYWKCGVDVEGDLMRVEKKVVDEVMESNKLEMCEETKK